MTEETLRVRSYLVAQANKLSIPDLVEKIRRDILPLREAAAAVPPAHFTERPTPADWSAAEVYTHILDMNEWGAQAIQNIIAYGILPPAINDARPAGIRTDLHTAEAYWQVFSVRREQFLAHMVLAVGNEHLDVPITHFAFGPLNWREWLLFMRVHDLDHIRQLQTIAQHFNQ